MTRSEKIFGFALVAIVGAWGCSKMPESGTTSRSSSQDAKVQRLEEDFRAAATARDQFRQKMLAAEEKLAAAEMRSSQFQSQLEEARVQRDTFKADLQTRTAERDVMAAQYESFRKNLKNLIGQAENALASPPTAAVPVLVGSGPQPPPVAGSALSN